MKFPIKAFRRPYFLLPPDEKREDEEDIPESNSESGLLEHQSSKPLIRQSLSTKFLRVAETIFVLISGWMFAVGLTWQLQSDKKCFEVANFYSKLAPLQSLFPDGPLLSEVTAPATDYIDTHYQLWQYNGTVGFPSPYAPRTFQEGPTPEIDEAWSRFVGM